jgi:type II secretory pathway pseudopilin PulG
LKRLRIASPSTNHSGHRRRCSDAFALTEALVAVAVVAIGFLGAFATAVHAGKLASAAEEEALVVSSLEQRIEQLRLLEWPALTDGTGITGTVWTARPEPAAGLSVTQETLTISPWDVAAAKTLQATWIGASSPTVSFGAGAQNLSDASAVRVVATLTWTGRRSTRIQTRSLVSVISRGGISKSDLP